MNILPPMHKLSDSTAVLNKQDLQTHRSAHAHARARTHTLLKAEGGNVKKKHLLSLPKLVIIGTDNTNIIGTVYQRSATGVPPQDFSCAGNLKKKCIFARYSQKKAISYLSKLEFVTHTHTHIQVHHL
jgi:hypothetical protein